MQIIRLYFIVTALCLVYIGGILHSIVDCAGPSHITMTVFDIGQGDAILVQRCDGFDVLIDGGPDNAVLYKLGTYLPYYDRVIDLVVLTHPDSDHVTGLVEVLKRYTVPSVLITDVSGSSATYAEFLRRSYVAKINRVIAGDVQGILIGKDIVIDIVHPVKSVANTVVKEINESSIVLHVSFGSQKVLLTGDTTKHIEEDLILRNKISSVDVLKVAHHGSKTSSAEKFLLAAKPELAVVSSGRENKFHHPSPEVTQRFDLLGIPWIDTQTSGDIIVKIYKDHFEVATSGVSN